MIVTSLPVREIAVACIVDDSRQRVLCAKRRADNPQFPSVWEFPGGKVEAGEAIADALIRECGEELGITPTVYQPLTERHHRYQDFAVCLHVYLVTAFEGEPRGVEGQTVSWVALEQLTELPFLPANHHIIEQLKACCQQLAA